MSGAEYIHLEHAAYRKLRGNDCLDQVDRQCGFDKQITNGTRSAHADTANGELTAEGD